MLLGPQNDNFLIPSYNTSKRIFWKGYLKEYLILVPSLIPTKNTLQIFCDFLLDYQVTFKIIDSPFNGELLSMIELN